MTNFDNNYFFSRAARSWTTQQDASLLLYFKKIDEYMDLDTAYHFDRPYFSFFFSDSFFSRAIQHFFGLFLSMMAAPGGCSAGLASKRVLFLEKIKEKVGVPYFSLSRLFMRKVSRSRV